MGFASFVGRVLFASIFILSAWQMFNEFGVDGGPAAKELIPKLDLAKKHISSQLHVDFPDIEVRQLVLAAMGLKGLGAILFVFGHGFGAFLLVVYLLCVAQCGALIFFWGMKNSITKRQLRKKVPKSKAA